MQRYNPKDIEQKWQDKWAADQTYKAAEDPSKPKKYILEYFPYPSGAAMHVGHVRNYTIGDVMARYNRMQGFNVLHPMGWDGFGLPAENFAIKNQISPRVAIEQNTKRFKEQLTQMGFSYDWSREINSTDPGYYRWTQWFFLLLYRKGLAYQKESPQWWCPVDKTVLANEQVEAGLCWRCGNRVEKKMLKQWFFKITDYADRLSDDLDNVDWSDAIKAMQRNWIGKSKGAQIDFRIADDPQEAITVFTTRPDTLYGATFMVLSPEHPLVDTITTEEQREVVAGYQKEAQAKSDVERQETNREKTGVFTGAYAINPANNERIPIWIADYVLMGYGTGAIMAVPAHDERDHAFAQKFNLPIVRVVNPSSIRDDAREMTDFIKKRKVVAFVENDKAEILTINWGKMGGRLTIGGTQEGDEAPEATALREVTEETGYDDLEVVEVGDETYYYKYFAFSKQEAHEIETTFVHVRLKSDSRREQSLDESEKDNFTVEWVSREQADHEIVEPLHRYGFEKFVNGTCYHGEGIMVNSGPYDGMASSEVRERIVADLSTPAGTSDRVRFAVDGTKDILEIAMEHPELLYGVTFIALSPNHPLAAGTKLRSGEDGAFTGEYVLSPLSGAQIPVWFAAYVDTDTNNGGMRAAVPAHNNQDYEFARRHKLPVRAVVARDFGKPLPDCKQVEGVVVIVYDRSTGTYLDLYNDNVHMSWLVSGGRDGNETFEQAAIRELAEEAGITKYERLVSLGQPVYSYYYNDNKKSNRRSLGYNYLAIVNGVETSSQKLEAHENFSLKWVEREELTDGIAATGGGVEHWLDAINKAASYVETLESGEEWSDMPYDGEGIMTHSRVYDGLSRDEARTRIVADLTANNPRNPAQVEYVDNDQSGEREPVFTQIEGESAVRPELPFVERDAVLAVVKHWKEDTYLSLKWHRVDWDTLITGGIEAGQTAEEAAICEIREETGYQHPVLKRNLGMAHAKFFHNPKNENRFAHFDCMYFELADGEREEPSAEEQANHTAIWVTKEEMNQLRLPGTQWYMWNKLIGDVVADTNPVAREVTNYKIRDWLISRQRYWGAPIPMIHCPKDGIVPVPEDQLPVRLPELEKFEPSGDGRSPLANVPEFVHVTCPECGGPAERETDTMDGFACSSWYFLRFADPHNDKEPFARDKADFWLPVDDYIGGAEHAVMHLLYARMWTKVMFDEGMIDFDEPFTKLRNQGMILAPDGRKMSKSYGNTIEPGELIEQGYGADSIRIMELFIGPWNQMANWSVEGMGGAFRFLQRIWTLVQEYNEVTEHPGAVSDDLNRAVHKTIRKVTEEMETMGFNTSIASLMETVNQLYRLKAADNYAAANWGDNLTILVQLIAPFAPHIAEELWAQLGCEGSVHASQWPVYDEKYLVSDMVTIVVQVNGKVRAELALPVAADESAVLAAAQADPKVQTYVTGKEIRKTVYVPGKLLSIVI